MKNDTRNPGKELYHQLRVLPWDELWSNEVARFDKATPRERFERVAVVRAVGVVFSESGPLEQRDKVSQWLRDLLHDPDERIRRYAMAAIPKIGASPNDEAELLSLLKATASERERKFLGQTLDKIGGMATLEVIEQGIGGLPSQTRQKVKASVARQQSPGKVRMDAVLTDFSGLRVHLRGRRGLEEIVRDEVEECTRTKNKFRVSHASNGLVVLAPMAAFTLGDIYALRCFGTVGLVIGNVSHINEAKTIEALAASITSSLSQRVLRTFTEGTIRYRLEFVSKGHQRAAVRLVANRAYALCPEILNDARNAPWKVNIHPAGRSGSVVELSPRLKPDPRFSYRHQDVPAASHPPLAACMARLAGKAKDEILWDPFCGSGLELIERALLGGVLSLYGTDRSDAAVAITRNNLAAAKVRPPSSRLTCCDFRDYPKVEGLGPNTVTLIITNPPMGRRVPIANLRGLIEDLFRVAAVVLKPGGRLVFANPLPIKPTQPSLQLQSRRLVDLGGFDCHLEVHRKLGR